MECVDMECVDMECDEDYEREKCPVCLEKLGETNIFITKCGHTFCGECILRNNQFRNSCPLCRNQMVTNVTGADAGSGASAGGGAGGDWDESYVNIEQLQMTYTERMMTHINNVLSDTNTNTNTNTNTYNTFQYEYDSIHECLMGILYSYTTEILGNNLINTLLPRRYRFSISDMNFESNEMDEMDEDVGELEMIMANLEMPS
jgi:hypothetical protein